MKKYIFLTFTIDGVTGGQRYVNNKVKWLSENGYDVIVFDHRGGLSLQGNVVLEYLKPYENNRYLELFFPPSYFSEKQRTKFLDELCEKIGEAEDYVVESNSGRLSFWGELLAQRLRAKHLYLDVGEHPDIRSITEYEYYAFKFDRNEFYLISPKVTKTLFSGYRDISDQEAEDHVYAAIMNVVPEEVAMPEIEHLPQADYNILSFGRFKPYFDNMIDEVVKFAQVYKDKKINFVIMGVDKLQSKYIKQLNTCTNLYYQLIPLKYIIPKVIFRISDVVIATAGCANISFDEGAKTISMNVETNQPLGVMGYTTINSLVDANQENNNEDLFTLLDNTLRKKMYEGPYTLIRPQWTNGYDFQVSLINDDRKYWPDVTKIKLDSSLRTLICKVLLRIKGIKIIAKIFNSKLGELI